MKYFNNSDEERPDTSGSLTAVNLFKTKEKQTQLFKIKDKSQYSAFVK